MLKNQIHYVTKVDDEEFTYICRAGCSTAKAYQAADEYRTYLYGVWKQQEEAAKAAEASQEKKGCCDVVQE